MINYDQKLNEIIKELNGQKKSVLLHSCCAPCSSTCLERLTPYFDVSVYFYNPNMDTESEYVIRANEQARLCKEFSVNLTIAPFNSQEFFDVAVGLENEKEGGSRCVECFKLRLKNTALKARAENYDYFTTTLTLSPLKNSELLNRLGEQIEKEVGVKFLPADFKKRGGYLRSIELSKQYSLYRQNYCGCVYSKR